MSRSIHQPRYFRNLLQLPRLGTRPLTHLNQIKLATTPTHPRQQLPRLRQMAWAPPPAQMGQQLPRLSRMPWAPAQVITCHV